MYHLFLLSAVSWSSHDVDRLCFSLFWTYLLNTRARLWEIFSSFLPPLFLGTRRAVSVYRKLVKSLSTFSVLVGWHVYFKPSNGAILYSPVSPLL